MGNTKQQQMLLQEALDDFSTDDDADYSDMQKATRPSRGPVRDLEFAFKVLNRKYVRINKKQEERNNKILHSVVKEVLDLMKETDDAFKNMRPRLEYIGSYYDGLRVGHATEYDLNVVLKLPIDYKKIVLDATQAPQGYTHIKLPSEFRRLSKIPEMSQQKGFKRTGNRGRPRSRQGAKNTGPLQSDGPNNTAHGKPQSNGLNNIARGRPQSNGPNNTSRGRPQSNGPNNTARGRPQSNGPNNTSLGRPQSNGLNNTARGRSQSNGPNNTSRGRPQSNGLNNTAHGRSQSNGPNNTSRGRPQSNGPNNTSLGRPQSNGLNNTARGRSQSNGPNNTSRGRPQSNGLNNTAHGRSQSNGPNNTSRGRPQSNGLNNTARGRSQSNGPNNTSRGRPQSNGPNNTARGRPQSNGLNNTSRGRSQSNGPNNTSRGRPQSNGPNKIARGRPQSNWEYPGHNYTVRGPPQSNWAYPGHNYSVRGPPQSNWAYSGHNYTARGPPQSNWVKHRRRIMPAVHTHKSTNTNNYRQQIENWCDPSYRFSAKKFRSWMQSVIDAALSKLPAENEHSLLKVGNVIYQVRTSQSGPANTIYINGGNISEQIDVDLVPTFAFDVGKDPIESSVDFKKVKANKGVTYFVVPKPTDDEFSWRLAFPTQEKGYLREKNNMKSTVKLMKLLRDVQGFDGLASYFIKTLFLRESEASTDAFWSKNSVSFLFLHMMKRLKGGLEKGIVENFWCPSHNLLENINEDTLKNWSNRVGYIVNDIETNRFENPFVVMKYFCHGEE